MMLHRHLDNFISFPLALIYRFVGAGCTMRINGVTYGELKTPLKVNRNLN